MACRQSLKFVGLSVFLALLGACAGREVADSGSQKPPLVLQEHRAFFTGGTTVHLMFWEENNEEIANVLLRWIEAHVEKRPQ